jgi:hypothetical protein
LLNASLPDTDLHKNLAIFVIPTDELKGSTLERWIQAEDLYVQIDRNAKDKSPEQTWSQFIDAFPALLTLSKDKRD